MPVLQNLEKEVSNYKKIKSAHTHEQSGGFLGDHLRMKCVVGLSSADLPMIGREESSMGFGRFYCRDDPCPTFHPKVCQLRPSEGKIKAFFTLH